MYRIIAKKIHPDKFSNIELNDVIMEKINDFKEQINDFANKYIHKYKTNKSISYLYLYGKELQTQNATINYGFKTIDIFIDQIGNKGGWGYGMNSVESLSMGICTLTEMNDEYNSFVPDHPFISVNEHTLESKIDELIINRNLILKHNRKSRQWVQKYHDIKNVSDELYRYYEKIGLLC